MDLPCGLATDEASINDLQITLPPPETIHHSQYTEVSDRGGPAQALEVNACLHVNMRLSRNPTRNDGFGRVPTSSLLLSLAALELP